MRLFSQIALGFSLLVLLVAGCKKDETATTTATASETMGTVESTTAAPAAVDTAAAGAETTAKLAGAQWAMRQEEIKNDPNGQWAVEATASSSWANAQGDADYSPMRATGPPNVERYADDGRAWLAKEADMGIEWLDLKFAKPVHASEVRIRESSGSGAIVKIELFDEQGNAHTVWQGSDPTTELNYLIVKFPKTEYKTNRVKVTLATNVVSGYNEIDAVQLIGTET